MKRILLLIVTLLFSGFALAAVNINTATKEELDALPGIGPAKAQAIIDYRNANGPFKTPEDIMKVKGIKEGEFGKIKNDITVSGATTGAVAKSAAKADTAKMDAKAAKDTARMDAKAAKDTAKMESKPAKDTAKMESKANSAGTKADAAAGGASKSDKNASSDKAPGKGEVTDQSAKAAKSSSDAKSTSKDSKTTATMTK